jgi:ABC-type multidrug transport system ATPase subunit
VASALPLQAKDLARAYGRLHALAGLSLTVGAGRCVALIGANGSGKSTAVRTIAGLLEPTGGAVRVCGLDPHTEPEAQDVRARLALVPDNPLLYPDLTVAEHLDLVALAHGVRDPQARIDELLARLELEHRRDFRPNELSRGMRQKVQLACAFVRPFELLVLDEPVVGLDPPSQVLLRAALAGVLAAGSGVLLTTHQLAFAEGLADHGILLDEGAVADEGPFADVATRARDRGWAT